MSNFSQYFPVSGGSGVGSGIPINSFAPFYVVNNETPGYNISTGLYTHPDGTFWLRTGKQIATTELTLYPEATGATQFNQSTPIYAQPQSGWTGGFNGSRGFVQHPNGTDIWQANWRDGEIGKFNKSDGTGFSVVTNTATMVPAAINTPTLASLYPSNDGTELIVFIVADIGSGNTYGIVRLSSTTGAVTATYVQGAINVPPTQYFGGQISVGDNIWLAQDLTSTIIEEWDFSITIPAATGVTLTITNGPPDVDGVGSDGTNLYVFYDNNNFWYRIDSSGVVSISFAVNSGGSTLFLDTVNNGLRTLSGGISASSFIYVEQITYGDITARTDTDTAQPLFVRVK